MTAAKTQLPLYKLLKRKLLYNLIMAVSFFFGLFFFTFSQLALNPACSQSALVFSKSVATLSLFLD